MSLSQTVLQPTYPYQLPLGQFTRHGRYFIRTASNKF